MKELLSNRTYQIIVGSILLVGLVWLFATGDSSDEVKSVSEKTETTTQQSTTNSTSPDTNKKEVETVK